MKKILIVIHNLQIGGAQKSLLSFLQALQAEKKDAYTISVMAIDPTGAFATQLPAGVTLVPSPRPLRWLGTGFSLRLLWQQFSLAGLLGEGMWLLRKLFRRLPKKLNLQQKLWRSWKRYIPHNPTRYDVAIAYMDGVPGYYVMDKVKAEKKVLWVHSRYDDQGYCPCFDWAYFERADRVVTISPGCRQVLEETFPQQQEKFHILPNISSAVDVLRMSREPVTTYDSEALLRLLTVARLNPQKGVDIAVDAARLLKQQGVAFRWLVAGDGEQRAFLQSRVQENGLQDEFVFLGACANPYAYMAACHIVVQPSRVEGKSIVLDEAKILCKPIIATRYQTVTDSLTHGENGWVVDMTPQALAEGIAYLWQNPQLRQHFADNLQNSQANTGKLIEAYLDTMYLNE